MKACINCGCKFDDSVSFCPNCGTSVSGKYPAHLRGNSKEPVSVGGWIGRSLIPMIPLVGSIVYLIMLFIWSGDTKKEDTFRNWAKAQLIVMAVAIVLAIIIAIAFSSYFAEAFRYM